MNYKLIAIAIVALVGLFYAWRSYKKHHAADASGELNYVTANDLVNWSSWPASDAKVRSAELTQGHSTQIESVLGKLDELTKQAPNELQQVSSQVNTILSNFDHHDHDHDHDEPQTDSSAQHKQTPQLDHDERWPPRWLASWLQKLRSLGNASR